MRQITRYTLLIVLLGCSIVTSAQRNRIKIIGIEYDNILGGFNSESFNNDRSLNRYAFCVGYERSFGSRITLSLSYFLYLSFDDERLYFDNIKVKSKNGIQVSAIGQYQEHAKYKILYESKYFFNEFEEEPEGTYFGTMLGINKVTQSLSDYEITPGSSSTSINYSGMDNSYSVLRYGFKFGIQYNGDLYLGVLFNTPIGTRLSSFVNKDGYEFGFADPLAPLNVIIGYNWGINF